MEKRRVVITGLGAVTPVGTGIENFWGSLIEGKSGAGPIQAFDASAYKSRIAGEVRDFNPLDHFDKKETRRLDRFCQFAVVAARQVMEDSGIKMDDEDPTRIGALLGVGVGGIGFIEDQNQVLVKRGVGKVSPFLIPKIIPNMAPGMVAIYLGLKGPNSCAVTACASGTNAIGDAFKLIQRGDAECMVTGGSESTITPLGVAGFDNMHAITRRNDEPEKASRPFEKDRDGFLIAEGAGLLMLEELEHAKSRGARIYCEIVGYGQSCDAFHLTAPAPRGEGASRAMKAALADAGLTPGDIDYINAHGTSTPLNDKNESLAICDTFGEHASRLMVSSTKSMTGHLLGGAGGVEGVATALAIHNSLVPPTINHDNPDPECAQLDFVPNKARKASVRAALSNSLGFGGHNAVICLKKYE